MPRVPSISVVQPPPGIIDCICAQPPRVAARAVAASAAAMRIFMFVSLLCPALLARWRDLAQLGSGAQEEERSGCKACGRAHVLAPCAALRPARRCPQRGFSKNR